MVACCWPMGSASWAGRAVNGRTPTLASAELFDPATRTLSEVMVTSGARFRHGSAVLPDGSVLLYGGSATPIELFQPALGTFETIGSSSGHSDFSLARLVSGDVLICAGFVEGPFLDVLRFDWRSRTFTPLSSTSFVTLPQAVTSRRATFSSRAADGAGTDDVTPLQPRADGPARPRHAHRRRAHRPGAQRPKRAADRRHQPPARRLLPARPGRGVRRRRTVARAASRRGVLSSGRPSARDGHRAFLRDRPHASAESQ
jgi:hypothetical protein